MIFVGITKKDSAVFRLRSLYYMSVTSFRRLLLAGKTLTGNDGVLLCFGFACKNLVGNGSGKEE